MVEKIGDTVQTCSARTNAEPSRSNPDPHLIDVLQAACQFHDAGAAMSLPSFWRLGAGNEPGFWAFASAIAQSLPDGDRERTMLLGLTGNEKRIELAAKTGRTPGRRSIAHVGPRTPSLFGDEDPTLFDRSPS